MPQIEVSFDIDANGILNVSAKDLASGRKQGITIAASNKLSKDEVAKMVKQAEEFAEKDRERAELITVRNQADSLTFEAERVITDQKDKLASSEVDGIRREGHRASGGPPAQGASKQEIQTATDELTRALHPVAQKLYQSGAAPPPGAEVPPTGEEHRAAHLPGRRPRDRGRRLQGSRQRGRKGAGPALGRPRSLSLSVRSEAEAIVGPSVGRRTSMSGRMRRLSEACSSAWAVHPTVPGDGERRREQVAREPDRFEHDRTVILHIGEETRALPGLPKGGERLPLDSLGENQPRGVGDAPGQLVEDRGPRVVGLVRAVTETEENLAAGEPLRDPALRPVGRPNGVQHVGDPVGAPPCTGPLRVPSAAVAALIRSDCVEIATRRANVEAFIPWSARRSR